MTGEEVFVTGWGYTATAIVTTATDREVTVNHPDKGLLTFTRRRNGTWTLKGFVSTYAPKMRRP